MLFVNAKRLAPAVSSTRLAPAALGALPPDVSFSPQPFDTQDVLESVSSAPYSSPDFGKDRRLVFPSLTVRAIGRRGLYVVSLAFRLRVNRHRSTRLH